MLITYARSAREADVVIEELVKISTGSAAKFKAIQADAAKSLQAAEKTIAEATALFDGGIDIIVNNAANGEDLELSSVTPETFDACFHPNVLFPLLLVKLSKPVLRKKARIVNISSAGARVGPNYRPHTLLKVADGFLAYPSAIMYGASKAALESVTMSLAKELGMPFPQNT